MRARRDLEDAPGYPATVVEALERLQQVDDRGYVFLGQEGGASSLSFDRLVRAAQARARWLQDQGLGKGERLAMVIPENEDFVLAFLGALIAGIVPVPMYPPLGLSVADGYARLVSGIVADAGAEAVLTTESLLGFLESILPPGGPRLLTLPPFDAGAEARPRPVTITPEDVCFFQFTSGSTAAPKGVVVTHANVTANAHAIMIDGLQVEPGVDRGVTWLPLYHDMGLVGHVLAPLFTGNPVVFISPLAFIRRPSVWMKAVSEYRGTVTFAPNFGFALAAKRATARDMAGLDLSCLRALGCGAEPIQGETLRRFVEVFAPAGLRREAVMPCYGMAEATLAVAFKRDADPTRGLVIDQDAYEVEGVVRPPTGAAARVREVVSCGRPFPGHELAIVSPAGQRLADGRVGEIVLRGPSVAAGYHRKPEATAETFADGWLHTGDVGFLRDGEIFVCGRMKDVIKLNGRTYHAHDIECVVERVEGVRPGNVIACAVVDPDGEKPIVLAETREGGASAALAEAIRVRVGAETGVRLRTVVLLRAGTLLKTSSGKVRRHATRLQYENDELGEGLLFAG